MRIIQNLSFFEIDVCRIVFDEILANLLTLSESRKRIKKDKNEKIFKEEISTNLIKELPFELTKEQKRSLNENNRVQKSEMIVMK